MKKIRFVINTLDCGGAETVLVNLLNNLPKDLFDVSLVSFRGGVNEANLPLNVSYKKIVRTNHKVIEKLLYKIIWHLPRKLSAFIFLRGNFDYEIAYLEGLSTQIVAQKRTNGKKIAFVHTDVSTDNIILRLYRSRRQCIADYNNFDKVVFVSKVAQQGFFRMITELKNSVVLHNVLDAKLIKRKAAEQCGMEYNTKGTKLISVGRLSKEKNYLMLLQVLSELNDKYDFELWIVGDGKERESLERFIQENNIDFVKLLGYQGNPYKFVKKADYYICSSLYEGYSTSVQEAVILGKPVLTTDCAGMREILRDGHYGIIVDNSEEALKEGLSSIMSIKGKEDDIDASQLDVDDYMSEQISKYISLFE